MDEIDLLKTIRPDVEPAPVPVREAMRRHLLNRADASARPGRARRRLARGVGLAFGALVIASGMVFSLAVWPVPFVQRPGPDAAASEIFRRAAAAAAKEPEGGASGYRYTKSQSARLAMWMVSDEEEASFSMLRPLTREIWIAPDGSGRIRETVGKPIFLREQDRANWVAAGSPEDRGINEDFGPGGLSYPNTDLPTNAIALRGLIWVQAVSTSVPTNVEMFVIVGDMLRETVAEPKLRAALFEVASTIDGVELLGETTDGAGRRGVAVGITTDYWGGREQRVMVFDPETWHLLEERTVVLDDKMGFPAGSVIGYTTYLASGVVDELP